MRHALLKCLCVRCYNENGVRKWSGGDKDIMWDRDGVLWCCGRKGNRALVLCVTDAPPEDCPYIVEHVMSEGEDAAGQGALR